MQKQYELNRSWIMDDTGEVMGETNFVISEAFYYRIGKSVLFVDRKKM